MTNMTNTNTIELRLRKKVVNHNGKTFDTFKLVKKDGTLVDFKFTRAVKNTPEHDDSIITVNPAMINEQKNTLYPVFWCKEVISSRPYATDKANEIKRTLEALGVETTDELDF